MFTRTQNLLAVLGVRGRRNMEHGCIVVLPNQTYNTSCADSGIFRTLTFGTNIRAKIDVVKISTPMA